MTQGEPRGGIATAVELSDYIVDVMRFEAELYREALRIKDRRDTDPILRGVEWPIGPENTQATDKVMLALLAPQVAYLPRSLLNRWLLVAQEMLQLLEGQEEAAGTLGQIIRASPGLLGRMGERSLEDVRRFQEVATEGHSRGYLVLAVMPGKPPEARFVYDLSPDVKRHLGLE